MYLTPANKNDLKHHRYYVKSKNFILLEEFANSEHECVKIEGAREHYRSLNTAQTSFSNSIKHYRFSNIKCVTFNGEVYLIKA